MALDPVCVGGDHDNFTSPTPAMAVMSRGAVGGPYGTALTEADAWLVKP